MQEIVLISKMEANLTKIEILIDSVYKEQCHEYLGKLSIKTEIDSALIDCIKQSVTTWSATRVTPRPHVISFTLNLASFLCKNEENFNALNSRNFFIKLVNVSKVRVNQVTLSVKLAYIKLLSSFLEHTSGVEWMIACNFWEDVYQLCLSNQNREIIKKSTHFVSKLLEITVSCDGKFCDNVVQRIILPLSENIYKSVAGEHLQPTLKLLGDILEYFLQGILSDEKNFDILFVFLKKFRLDERISDFIGTEQSKCFSFRLGKIVFIMQFLELYVKISTNGSSAGDIDATIRNIKNNFILSTFKEDFKDVVEFSYFGQLYWKLVDSKIPQVKTLPFSNQLAIALIIPHCCLMFRFCYDKGDWEEMLTDEFRDVYIHKLYQMVGHDMLRTCYLWRDSVIDRPNIFEICAQCNDRIRRAQRYLSRESAVVIVQMLIYNLKDCVHFVKQSPQKLDSFVNQELYFEQIFGILAKFIEDFRITWKDSLEATDILTICFDFFMLHSWPKHIGVKVLNLINIATAKYMAPNLALLLDNTTDSTVALLGPLLYAKLFDVSEVKRAALDVICTMANISRSIVAESETMGSDVVLHRAKLELLFEKLIEEKCQNTVDEYLDKLLNYVSQEGNTEVESTLQIFSEWLEHTVDAWSAARVTPPTNIILFILNLTSLLSKNEERFLDLSADDFFMKLLEVSKARRFRVSSDIRLSYFELLWSFLQHKSGVDLLVTSKMWEDFLSNRSDGVEFMSKFLETSLKYDEVAPRDVIKQIMLPLSDRFGGDPREDSIKFVENLLLYLFERIHHGTEDFKLVLLFLENFQEDKNFVTVLSDKFLLMMQFLDLRQKIVSKVISAANIADSVDQIKSDFLKMVSKGTNFDYVIEFCRFSFTYWKLMDSLVANKNESVTFSNEITSMYTLPQYCLILKYCLRYHEIEELSQTDELRGFFLDRLLKLNKSRIFFRVFYTWRERLLTSPDLFQISIRGLDYIKDARNQFSRDQVVLLFQVGIYLLKDIIEGFKKFPKKIELFQSESIYIWSLFDLLCIFITEFKITWKDTFEAVDIVDLSSYFLSLSGWPTNVVVQGLKLINIAINRYMLPNLALLIEHAADPTLAVLGWLVSAKLVDDAAEIRKNTLEVICTMARISYSKNDCSPTLKLFEGWLKITIATWSNTKVVPLSNVGSFILNCTSLLSKREEIFCNLNSNNFFTKLINVVKARQSGATPTLKTAYIKLLSSLLEHRSGVEFMIACNFWEDVYQWSLSKESDQIAFESTQFISKLLERTVDFDEDFCDHVVKRLLLALGGNIYKSFKAATGDDISAEVASIYVEPTLKLIDNILDHFLVGICLYGKDFRVLLVFLTNFQKEEKISDFMIIAQIKCLAFYVEKITFIMEFLQLYTKTKKTSVAVNISESVSKIQTSFIASLSKANYTDYTKCCSFGLLYWKLVESKFPVVPTKKTPLSHQLVTMILVPNLVLDIKSSHLTMQELEETYLASDTIRESFAHKLLKSMDQDLIRIFYTWREHVTDPNMLLTVCIEGAIWAKRSCRYFCKEQAVLMFTSLIYILKDMLSHMKNSSETREVFLKRSQYFAHIFDLLAKITEEFHLSWKDSWAANEVVDLCFEYLMVPGWPTDLLVQVLRMINIGIARCMSPNLALLVDGAKDSTIGLLGPLLYSKLKDAAEVREAALEVVSTVACMSSDSKFLTVLAYMLRTFIDERTFRDMLGLLGTVAVVQLWQFDRNTLNRGAANIMNPICLLIRT